MKDRLISCATKSLDRTAQNALVEELRSSNKLNCLGPFPNTIIGGPSRRSLVNVAIGPPGYVAIDRNFSSIPLMFIPNTAILAVTIFLQFLQFPRKIYSVLTEWANIKYGKILKSYLQAMWQSVEIPVLFHPCVYETLPIWLKRAFQNSASFPGKFFQEHCLQTWTKNEFGEILKSYPLAMWESMENLSRIPQICTIKCHHSGWNEFLETFPCFPRNFRL